MVRFLNDRHELRMQKLSELVDDRQKKLQDHDAGHRKLSSEVCVCIYLCFINALMYAFNRMYESDLLHLLLESANLICEFSICFRC